jgi:hypothetical protein
MYKELERVIEFPNILECSHVISHVIVLEFWNVLCYYIRGRKWAAVFSAWLTVLVVFLCSLCLHYCLLLILWLLCTFIFLHSKYLITDLTNLSPTYVTVYMCTCTCMYNVQGVTPESRNYGKFWLLEKVNKLRKVCFVDFQLVDFSQQSELVMVARLWHSTSHIMHTHVHACTCVCTYMHVHYQLVHTWCAGCYGRVGQPRQVMIAEKNKKKSSKETVAFSQQSELVMVGRLWPCTIVAYRLPHRTCTVYVHVHVHVHACTCACRHMHVLVHAYVSTVGTR